MRSLRARGCSSASTLVHTPGRAFSLRCKVSATQDGTRRTSKVYAQEAQGRMSPAEVARTISSLVSHGTLSTISTDGMPLGTFVTFVLDPNGSPLLRLRADAAHTANLKANKNCTLFLHAAEEPARNLARVTLLGDVEDLGEGEASEAAARHSVIYGSALGVDAPQPDDIFMRLNVKDCFYVAGLGEPAAEHLSAEEYSKASADDMKDEAAELVRMFNEERKGDILRLAARDMDVSFDDMYSAEMLWIDTRGVDFKGQTVTGLSKMGRFAFPREALDNLDALSLITMSVQEAWEIERQYTPVMPELTAKAEA